MSALRTLGLMAGLAVGLLPAAASAQALPGPSVPPVQTLAPPSDGPPLKMLRSLRDLDQPVRELTWSGRVIDVAGEPVAGADVWFLPDGETLLSLGHRPRERMQIPFGLSFPPPDLFDEVPLSQLPHTLTDAAGRFELSGPWRRQRADGDAMRVGLEQPAIVVASGGYATRVDAASPDEVNLGEIRLLQGTKLRGRIVDQSGLPLPGVDVRVHNLGLDDATRTLGAREPAAIVSGLHDTVTDDAGVFELAGLYPGHVVLRVSRPDRGRIETKWLVTGGAEGGAITGVGDILLPAGTSISGVVCDGDGRGIADALVLAVAVDWHGFGLGCIVFPAVAGQDPLPAQLAQRLYDHNLTAATDAGGGFSIVGHWDGPITLYAQAPGFEPLRLPDVQPSASGVRLQLEPSATIALHFIDAESGQSVQADHLRAFRRGVSDEARPIAWEEHAHAVPVSTAGVGEQRHWLVDRAGPLGTDLAVAARGHSPARFALAGCQPGEHLELTLPLPRALRCEGRVVDDSGMPIAGACVDLTEHGQHRTGVEDGTLTDADGRFAFDSLAAGEWDLVVKSPDWIEAVIENVVVSAEAANAPLLVTLHRGGTIRGTVDPVAYARAGRPEIALDAQPPGQPDSRGYGRFSRPYARADEHGVFEFRGVPPGVHRLTLGEQSVEITVVAGQTVEVALDTPAVR